MIIEEIAYQDPFCLFKIFANQSETIFFDSSQYHEQYGRYSFIGVFPYHTVSCSELCQNPWQQLANHYCINLTHYPELPPFLGGVAGYLSYDLKNSLEVLPISGRCDQPIPYLNFSCYDLVISFDHLLQRSYISSTGMPDKSENLAKHRLKFLKQYIAQAIEPEYISNSKITVSSNFSQESYMLAVQSAREYILNGDIFEVNLSQRFEAKLPSNFDLLSLYSLLRTNNYAPFASFYNCSDTQILSASPERFLQLIGQQVITKPIKGTIKRSKVLEQDIKLRNMLQNSIKDRAENIMIVDLMRNDLSKVCTINSVTADKICKVESFAEVHHLVSTVSGMLQPNATAIDLLKACFPGGSITGAPKIRAMEVIDKLEPHLRGSYCGSLFYLGLNGSMDSSILIRSYICHANKITFHAGGAIVLDSDPLAEYLETLAKANALYKCLTGENLV